MQPIITIITKNNTNFIFSEYTTQIHNSSELCIHITLLTDDDIKCIIGSTYYDGYYKKDMTIDHIEYDAMYNKGITPEIMIHTYFTYVNNKYSSITHFHLYDMSRLFRETDITSYKPIYLPYLSIVYNGKTWLEHHFNAKYKNTSDQELYINNLDFLYKTDYKMNFNDLVKFAHIPADQIDSIEDIYNSTSTYFEFFHAIPEEKRYDILQPWLDSFISLYMSSYYNIYGWVIDITNMPNKSNEQYYLPDGIIIYYSGHHNMGRLEDFDM